jgi:2-isopropylmalate synthase
MSSLVETAPKRVEIYDTTLRDGTQGLGVSLSLGDKLRITRVLDDLGVDFIEGGYPLSNPKDAAYFREVRALDLRRGRVVAFGMTRRRGISAAGDDGMKSLLASEAQVVTIVGKTWDLHVDEVLRVSRQENLDMIRETLAYLGSQDRQVFYDAEHFFDGYRANPGYALETLRAAVEGGATRLILCDTNGGALPEWIAEGVAAARAALGSTMGLGIHCHNDGGLAVANTLTAVRAGAVQVQGTINGIGERCGNVDLLTVAANLKLKMGIDCLEGEPSLRRLTETSRFVSEIANLAPIANQPYVGSGAFAHKGGMHVHAVNRLAASYEHVPPSTVGNARQILVSELAGASSILARLGESYPEVQDRQIQRRVLERVQDLEHRGYVFEAALACLELVLLDVLGRRRPYWQVDYYRCVVHRRRGEAPYTEAAVKALVGGEDQHHVAEGGGPVHALDSALRRCLGPRHPEVGALHLRDYKVRVIGAGDRGADDTAARVRVVTDFVVRDPNGHETGSFSTVGVSENVVDASWEALIDAFEYHLIKAGIAPA